MLAPVAWMSLAVTTWSGAAEVRPGEAMRVPVTTISPPLGGVVAVEAAGVVGVWGVAGCVSDAGCASAGVASERKVDANSERLETSWAIEGDTLQTKQVAWAATGVRLGRGSPSDQLELRAATNFR